MNEVRDNSKLDANVNFISVVQIRLKKQIKLNIIKEEKLIFINSYNFLGIKSTSAIKKYGINWIRNSIVKLLNEIEWSDWKIIIKYIKIENLSI